MLKFRLIVQMYNIQTVLFYNILGRRENLASIFDMIPDISFSASSTSHPVHSPAASRLYKMLYDGAWIPASPQTGEYITADLGTAYNVVAVANQGGRFDFDYLTEFKFLYSMDGVIFEYVVDDNDHHACFCHGSTPNRADWHRGRVRRRTDLCAC